MKSIHPVAYQLSVAEDRIKSLEKENQELRLEVARLTRQRPPQSIISPPPSPKRRRLGTCDGNLPAYARSTAASRGRSSPSSSSSTTSTDRSSSPETPPQHVVVDKKRYVYRDGELTKMTFGYLKSTVSTRHRDDISALTRKRLRSFTPDDSWKTELPEWDPPTDHSSDADHSDHTEDTEELQPANTLRVMSQATFDDLVDQKGIEVRTRLNDDAWTRRPGHMVYIDHDALFDILSQAETLAKRCLWNWMRTNRPEDCRHWIGYRSDIDFGRDRISTMLAWLPHRCLDFRRTRATQVKTKLFCLIGLRNFLHHFNGRRRGAYRMDAELKLVQQLAVLLYDEEGARQARALRDRLHEEANRTVREIETFMMLTSLPEAGILWKPHHADLVDDAATEVARGCFSNTYPLEVYAAAHQWLSNPRGLAPQVSQPEVQDKTQPEGQSNHGSFLTSTKNIDAGTFNGKSGQVRNRRRNSVSVDAGYVKPAIVVGGRGGLRTRRHTVSVSKNI